MSARCIAAALLGLAHLASASASPLELSTEFFLVPERPAPSPAPPPVAAPPPGVVVATRGDRGGGGGGAVLRREPWVVPLLVVAALCMAVMAGFEVLVLCKARRASPPPSRRHLFLGQMLLLGLFLCAAVGAAGAAQPSPATCGALRLGAGVASALVFAALLVKCVFLISLNAGVYLPAPYQALLLLFAVLIQVAVGLQWLLHAPPSVRYLPSSPPPSRRLVVSAEDLLSPPSPPQPLCRAPFADLLLSLVYVAALIALVALLAVKSRGIRDNYREATFIGLSVGCVVPIWVLWVLGAFTVGERHRDACLAFGLVATAAVVFLVMFMPKGRQLAAMGREGVYAEDREERCSTLSRAGSGYSPSFYHFKPIKCGGGGGAGLLPPGLLPPGLPAPAPAPPPHLGLHHHHHHAPHPHKAPPAPAPAPADRVTLVAAPSYTRMYHYYPYCYYPGGVYVKPDDGNVYTTLEPTLSSNPNVFFQRSGVHPGMMY